MPIKSNGRTAIGPLSVRMSVEERTEARRKASVLSVKESEFARLAMAEFDADGLAERRRRTFHGEPDGAAAAGGAEAVT